MQFFLSSLKLENGLLHRQGQRRTEYRPCLQSFSGRLSSCSRSAPARSSLSLTLTQLSFVLTLKRISLRENNNCGLPTLMTKLSENLFARHSPCVEKHCAII